MSAIRLFSDSIYDSAIFPRDIGDSSPLPPPNPPPTCKVRRLTYTYTDLHETSSYKDITKIYLICFYVGHVLSGYLFIVVLNGL